MNMAKPSELIVGSCTQLLFSPKGSVEGVLVKVKGRIVQVSMPADVGVSFARTTGVGKRVRLLARADDSPKAQDGAHPVYMFESLADAAGQSIDFENTDPKNVTIKGIVAALHFARHGQPNGVILESGEFIHLRPHGMVQVGLDVGSRVSAIGAVRMTVLGTRLLEAHQVNRMPLA
jgi:hypothetical protein